MTWFLFLLIWIVFVGLNVLGTATLLHTLRRQHPKKFTSFVRHGVSVLKPLKGVDPSLRENLESFFNLVSNVPHELLFSLENERDEAYALVLSLLDQYPSVPARVFILENAKTLDRGLNPKLKNLSQSYDECAFDLVLISDSNVRVPPTLLCTLIQEMDSSTGLVTAIVAGQAPRGMGGILEAMYLNTFYARFMALSNRFAKPCVVGKMMMFRKSTASRFGGIRILSQFLAEDFMAGESFQKLGLKIATSSEPAIQIIGKHSFQAFWTDPESTRAHSLSL
jgi:ceramide glucosyltransferase